MKHWLLALATVLIVSGCSSRKAPAPLSILNSQPEHIPSAFDVETYEVVAGDTLFAVAWYSGNDYRDLAKWNNIYPPYTLSIGQKLQLRPPEAQTVAKNPSGRTSEKSHKTPVASSKKQAYGGNQEVVNKRTSVPNDAATTTPKIGEFPARVAKWTWPAQGKVIERFKAKGDVNKGIDIQASKGSPIVAAAAGRVVYTGSALRGYGNLIIIKHTDTFLSAYAHNDRILVNEREWVAAGQQIATMGNSGTNLVKLHFEVRYRGKSLDPMRYLPSQQ
ncbi:peptidoglycan DD-metalloendopeptidase family protein [Alteromonas sediminis]|uniref:peptidoglycan DD-metalloendopeptidase family protein n=1 Tax=Alteromonas sediminis TaxID=2259342 RepID=UPI001F0C513B|nr:peptidoglycan DD-metalloendopeptidase family protein [Alteromonas sediminis]